MWLEQRTQGRIGGGESESGHDHTMQGLKGHEIKKSECYTKFSEKPLVSVRTRGNMI